MTKKMAVKKQPPLRVRELSAAEIPLIFPLIQILNPEMSERLFRARIKAMLPLGYRAVAVFSGTDMVAISGFWIRTRLWCGKQLDMDNFVVRPELRGSGVGQRIVQWLEALAIAEKCDLMVLDSYVQSHLTHRFYYRNGFTATGYHLTKIPGTNTPFSR